MSERRLRTGRHQQCNVYWADVESGREHTADQQVGYIRIPELAQAMVDAYNSELDALEDNGYL